MLAFAPRPLTVLALFAAGALLTLAVVAVAGGDGQVVWVAVAGGTACACGLIVGSTARLVPAAALAIVAAAALVLAVREGDASTAVEVRPYPAPAVADEPQREPRARTSRVKRPAAPAPVTPPQFVRRFYEAIEGGRFARAWGRLGPAVQARSPSFEAWRAGYATTVSNRVEDVRVEPDGAVRHVLVAVDRTPCGTTTERRYEVLWYLARSGRTFTATDVDAVQLAGVDPALACG